MSDPISIPAAAEKYRIDARRIRGKVWQEHQTGAIDLPIGSLETDQVYDDWRVEKLARSLGDSGPPKM